MWPIKRKKKSARKELKQVYYYIDDYITLRIISEEQDHLIHSQVVKHIEDLFFPNQHHQLASLVKIIDGIELKA